MIPLTSIKRHCDLCGEKGELVHLEVGPYSGVCRRCHNLPFVSYENKGEGDKIGKLDVSGFKSNLKVLLVEPNYYTKYPPLGLLKIASFHRNRGDIVKLHRVKEHLHKRTPLDPLFEPDIVYITSLFTWAWEPVWDATRWYKRHFKEAKVYLGGVYASILPEHAVQSGCDFVNIGLIDEVENLLPSYDLVKEWKSSMIFGTRGCVRRCSFCAVPKLEGKINTPKPTISHLINENFTKAVICDNNILASPNRDMVFAELTERNLIVDFNGGLDARLITPKIAKQLSKIRVPYFHLAYDTLSAKHGVKKAIELLSEEGIRRNKMIFYTLYNHKEDPSKFFTRLKDLMNWGVVAYPMRFEPLNALAKNKYISPKWTENTLEMIAEARRVMGFGGAFPPYPKLRTKIINADNLEEALKLEKPKSKYQYESIKNYF